MPLQVVFVIALVGVLTLTGASSELANEWDVLRSVPVSPFAPDSGLSPEMAEIYTTTPSSSFKVHENRRKVKYEVLLSLTVPSDKKNKTEFVTVNALDITNPGQTWRRLAELDFRALKAPCNQPRYFLPAMAVTPDKKHLVFFGFGPRRECDGVFSWTFGEQLVQHPTRGGGKVPHVLHAIAVLEVEDKLHLYSYGGMSCDCFAPDENTTACITNCRSISGSLWRLSLPKDGTRGRPTGWFRLKMSRNSRPLPLILPSLHAHHNTLPSTSVLIVFGGLTPSAHPAAQSLTLLPHATISVLQVGGKRQGSVSLLTDINVSGMMRLEAFQRSGGNSGWPFIPRSVYLPYKDYLVMMGFPEDHLHMSVCYGLIRMIGGIRTRAICRPFDMEKTFLMARRNSMTLVAASYRDVYITELGAAAALAVTVPPYRGQKRRIPIDVSVFPDLLQPGFQFAGSSSCLVPSPAFLPANNFTASPRLLLTGGSCHLETLSPTSVVSSAMSEAVSNRHSLPVWIVEKHCQSAAGYVFIKRSLAIGPRSPLRVGHSLTRLSDNEYLVYGGLENIGAFSLVTPIMHSLAIDDTGMEWQKRPLKKLGPEKPVPRAFHIAFRHNSSCLIVHGGLFLNKTTSLVLCDLWIYTTYLSLYRKERWFELTRRLESSGHVLPCLYGHSYTEYQGTGLIYGGFTSSSGQESGISDPVAMASLIYTIHVSTDASTVTVMTIAVQPPLPRRAFHSLSVYTNNSLLLLGGIKVASLSGKWTPNLLHTPEIRATTTHLIALDISKNPRTATSVPFFHHVPMTMATVFNRSLVFGGLVPKPAGGTTFFKGLNPGNHCPLGQGKKLISGDCESCQIGYSSNSNGRECVKCRPFSTTNRTGATECHLPQPCTPGFCHGHGKCWASETTFQAYCVCHFQYLAYDNCQIPFVPLFIGLGVAVFLALLLYALFKSYQRKTKLRRKERELQSKYKELAAKKKQLDELFEAVHVKWKYLSLVARIYPHPEQELVGQVNEVWQAELGDMPVAVKVLKSQQTPDCSLKEFVQEAEMLRTVNHPNIVSFLGAGTQAAGGKPFLVMEFVKGGSLYHRLHDHSIPLEQRQRLSFALDAAKGMEYLHSRKPARIHRDLKSANLLVTSKGHVKVADFGTIRFIEILADKTEKDAAKNSSRGGGLRRRLQRLRPGKKVISNTMPLLSNASNPLAENSQEMVVTGWPMTAGVGTDRWKAPETLQMNYYSENTDAYSFGVVMWEIFTRQLPYQEFSDNEREEICEQIKLGNRPSLPPDMPYDYRHLVEQCLQQEATRRPTFPPIVTDLQAQYDEQEP